MGKNKYKVLIYPTAESDLSEIREYFKKQLNTSPNGLFEKFLSFIDILGQNPHAYPVVKEPYLNRLKYRMIPVDNYLIFYTVRKEEVQIHRFIYGKRNYRMLF